MNKFALLLLVGAVSRIASAQLVSVGALGGVPVPDTKGNDESPPYIVGGSVEVRLPADFAMEADALYRRLGSTSSFLYSASLGVTATAASRERGNSWEFPVLGKYYFGLRSSVWQPFLGAGFSFRTVGRHDANDVVTSILSGGNLQQTLVRSNYRDALDAGAAITAGVRFHAGRFALLPQVRYTRWGGENNLTSKNETSFLLGVAF